jgi:hypothetical protein
MKPWEQYTEEGIKDLAREALDAACLLIQTRLGVETGDLASMFFDDDRVEDSLRNYIRSELHWAQYEE